MQRAEIILLCFQDLRETYWFEIKKDKLMDFQRYLKNVMQSGHNKIISEVK